MSKKEKCNEKIKCDVESCTNNNCEEGCCELNSIEVSCTCDNDSCKECEETICASFEERGGPLTDNEYEVDSEDDDE